MKTAAKPRLFYIDNLRTFLIILVILVHLTITYGAPTGLWYIHEGIVDFPWSFPYVYFQVVSQAFFMGLLFLLSGYFTPAAFDRKGAAKFLGDRAVRLLIPIAVFIFLLDPLMAYALGGFQGSLLGYFLISPLEGLGFGPLWFVEALLYFALAYLAWRAIKPKPTAPRPFPKNWVILLFGLFLGIVTFGVRLFYPVGYTFELLNFQWPFFPQYIALFAVGLLAFRGNWLQTIPAKTGRLWGRVAAAMVLVLHFIFVVGILTGDFALFYGGLTWQAAAYALWEQMFCVAVSIGLVVWFREKLNRQNRLTKALSDGSYAAYILQAPILIYLALALASLELPLMLKFLLISPIAVALCFLAGYLARKIPKANKVL